MMIKMVINIINVKILTYFVFLTWTNLGFNCFKWEDPMEVQRRMKIIRCLL